MGISTYLFLILFSFSSFSFDVIDSKNIKVPKNNPMSAGKVDLGKILFFDRRLSRDGSISCEDCHNVSGPRYGGEDGLSLAVGIGGNEGFLSTPTVWNSAFYGFQYWDGRAISLEEQAIGPLLNPIEMGNREAEEIEIRLKAIPGYKPLFKKAFPGSKRPITIENVIKAISTYERTLVTPGSLFDGYLKNEVTLSSEELSGFNQFKKIGCDRCHSGATLGGSMMVPFPPETSTDNFDQKVEIAFLKKKYGFDLPKDEDWRKEGVKVPSLRNIALTGPYWDNGSESDLGQVVYTEALFHAQKNLEPKEIEDILSFLKTLTGEIPKQEKPEFLRVPSPFSGDL